MKIEIVKKQTKDENGNSIEYYSIEKSSILKRLLRTKEEDK